MRRMLTWALTMVAAPGAPAANGPWLGFAQRREVTITRVGPYIRVVLTRLEAASPAPAAPHWA
jgi:hypothetical protein